MERRSGNKNVVFYGWWVIGALLVIEMICPMGRFGMTAFFPFVTSELKWSRYLVSSAQSMTLWIYALLVPFTGWMAGPACVIPRQSVELYNLFKARRWEEALSFQKKLWRINWIFQKYSLAPCIKPASNFKALRWGIPSLLYNLCRKME